MTDLKTDLGEAVSAAFAAEGVDASLARVTVSDRPDLADFQSNGALAAAKALKANPRELATKAAAQVLGHLTKVLYFAMVIEGPAGRDLEQWLVMGYAAAFAVVGTTLSRSFLDRMSDKQFYHWTRRVILALGAVYIAQGLWLMVTR